MTPEQVDLLTAPFATNEHEFLKGKVYLTESAITRRLDEVDPNWSFVIRLTEHRGEKTAIYAALTVAGVTRESNGMGESNYGKDKPRLPENEVNEREKSALTDALKRCARLFGIGRYMLDMGDSVSDPKTLDRWLKSRYGTPQPVATPQTVTEFVSEQKPEAVNPSISEQRKDNWRKFAAYWHKEAQLNNAKLCEILEVSSLLEYDGNFDDANQAVLEWLNETGDAVNAARKAVGA